MRYSCPPAGPLRIGPPQQRDFLFLRQGRLPLLNPAGAGRPCRRSLPRTETDSPPSVLVRGGEAEGVFPFPLVRRKTSFSSLSPPRVADLIPPKGLRQSSIALPFFFSEQDESLFFLPLLPLNGLVASFPGLGFLLAGIERFPPGEEPPPSFSGVFGSSESRGVFLPKGHGVRDFFFFRRLGLSAPSMSPFSLIPQERFFPFPSSRTSTPCSL